MRLENIPFTVVDWNTVPAEEHKGESGAASWKTQTANDIRLRMVEYSPGYVADHWCNKGHIILILEGELIAETKDGRINVLRPGMSYLVADDLLPHKSHTDSGVKMFIVD